MTTLTLPPATTLRTWLQALPASTVLGQRCATHWCPLVVWLRQVFGQNDIEVHEAFVRVNRLMLQTPEWLYRLVLALDYAESTRWVTVGEMLTTLETIMTEDECEEVTDGSPRL